MSNKAYDTYSSAIQFVPDWYRTKELCKKSLDNCPFVFHSVSDWFKT